MRDTRVEAGEKIRNRRLSLGYKSQTALARDAGVGPRMVAAAETGERVGPNTKVRLDRALKWVEGYGIDALLAGEEPTSVDEVDDERDRAPSREDMLRTVDSLEGQIQELKDQLRRMGEGA